MEDLPSVSPSQLRRDPECGHRAAQLLAGASGKATLGSARWAVDSRLRGDAELAHSELRVANESSFPVPSDLTVEQQAVHRAAARGYLAVFGTEPTRSTELPRSRSFDDLGVTFRANPGIGLVHADGRVEIRRVQARGSVPVIDDVDGHTIALLLGELPSTPPAVHLVAADLLSLEVTERVCDPVGEFDDAFAWLVARLAQWRSVAGRGRAVAGSECGQCVYVWNCPVHKESV